MNNIEILENYVKELNENKKNHKLAYSTGFGKYWSDFGKAIENLIQENKELKEQLQKYYNGELYTAKQLKNIEENQWKYFIHKSKVTQKIQELEYDQLENLKNICEDRIKIQAYKELLEEGE